MDLERISRNVEQMAADGVTFIVVTTRLAATASAMWSLSRAVRGAYDYVESCAQSVDQQAEIAAGLNVSGEVVDAHRDAAGVMRGVLDDAQQLADEAEEMAADFQSAEDDHRADYGPVHEAMTTKPGTIADRRYYANQ